MQLAMENIALYPDNKRLAYENILWALINTKSSSSFSDEERTPLTERAVTGVRSACRGPPSLQDRSCLVLADRIRTEKGRDSIHDPK